MKRNSCSDTAVALRAYRESGAQLQWLAGCGLACCLFIVIAVAVVLGMAGGFDRAGAIYLHRFDSGVTAILMEGLTAIGDPKAAVVVALVGTVWTWRWERRASVILLGVTLCSVTLAFALKLGFHRPRPALFPRVVEPSTYSFPSEHALAAVAIYGICAAVLAETRPHLKHPAALIVSVLAVLIGLSRVVLGVHWPTDVLGGFSAGLSILAAGVYLLKTPMARSAQTHELQSVTKSTFAEPTR